jgi:signal transduction histidine kinase
MESDSGVHPAVKVTGKARSLPPNVESNLLRIGQEAAANALKHAHAKSLNITLLYEAHCVRLCIEDDGRGFEMKQIPGHDLGHFGLLGMRERTEKIGGRLEVSSTPGEGTRVEATVPI